GQTLDDLNRPSPANPNPGGGGLVGRIGPDDPRPFDVSAEFFEGQLAAIAILHTGRSDDQRPEQSEVSTTACRLRPTTFFPRMVAPWPALRGVRDALAVEYGSRGPGSAACLLSNALAKLRMQALPGGVLLPTAEVMKHNPIGR